MVRIACALMSYRAVLEADLAKARKLRDLCGDDLAHRVQIARILRALSRYDARQRREKIAGLQLDPSAKIEPVITARAFDIPTVRVRAFSRP